MTEKRIKIDGWACKCERCGHQWQSLGPELPLRCPGPNCKTPYWRTAARARAVDIKEGGGKGRPRKAS